jgi:hypothetical protein
MSAAPADDMLGLQRQFMARLRGLPDNDLASSVDRGRVSREVGLRIYTHAYGARLREALDNDHDVLGRYLGDDLWETLCSGYIAEHPSRQRSLRDFGNDLPAYLTRAEAFREHPEVAELARFERHLPCRPKTGRRCSHDSTPACGCTARATTASRSGVRSRPREHHLRSPPSMRTTGCCGATPTRWAASVRSTVTKRPRLPTAAMAARSPVCASCWQSNTTLTPSQGRHWRTCTHGATRAGSQSGNKATRKKAAQSLRRLSTHEFHAQ